MQLVGIEPTQRPWEGRVIPLDQSCVLQIDRKNIDLTTTVFGHKFAAPLIVGAITGGTHEATTINSTIAEVVEELGL